MTQVFINPEIQDYFVEHDFREARNDNDNQVSQSIVEDFSNEKIILLRNLRLDADIAFLRGVTFYQKWKWKKLALSSFEAVPAEQRKDNPQIVDFVQEIFTGDWGRFTYFLEQATLINSQIRAAVNNIFANYRFSQRHIIWRFTETRVENLHFDVDRNCDNFELVRLYFNLDDIPRIWYTSETFTTTAREWYDKLDLSRFRRESYDKLLKELTTKVFGDWHMRGKDKVPRHLVLFEPGDVWLSDGRLVSHQVIYGRRVVSTLFVADSSKVPDPNKTFAHKIATLHAQGSGPGQTPETANEGHTAEKAPPGKPKNPLNLTISWEDLPEHARKDTIVRL
jgi:hypothetical protein